MPQTCSQCGVEFKRIGQHWSLSSECNNPTLTKRQEEIVTGLLMGDGWIRSDDKNPYLAS